MKKTVMMMLFSLACTVMYAQERSITGVLTDRDTKETLAQVTIQMLTADSTYVTGVTSGENGKFRLKAPSDGKYILKFSSVGYIPAFKNVEVKDGSDTDMGEVVLGAEATMLKGATVTGHAARVVVREDTLVYNAAAYRTPEGSVIEELIKRLPGAKIDDDGKVTINGQEVKKIKVDGKEFMTGDTETALKNLPTSIVEKVKAYNDKSDLSRVTGIDDGNEETVLDFALKRGMNRGLFSNADVSYGTEDRYAERLMGAYFTDKLRFMFMGNANNVNNQGFPGGGGRGNFGRGRNGLNTSKMLGMNFNYDDGEKFKLDGSVRWNHNNSDARSKSSAENFVSTLSSFSNSLNQSYTRGDRWNAQMRLEWKPDTMTNIMFRPSVSYSANDSRSTNRSASYNSDPYNYVDNPLDEDAIATLDKEGVMVNSNNSSSIGYNESKQFGGSLQYNRRLGSKGRNFTVRGEGRYSEGNSNSLSLTNVHLYQVLNQAGADSTYQTNRYRVTPTRNWNYALQATYSEPLWKGAFLQLSYKFNYSFSKSDQNTYDFSNLGEDFFSGLSPEYRGWDKYLARLNNPYESYLDTRLSRYSEYKNRTHDIELTFRMIGEKYNFNVGVLLQPQHSNFVQDYLGVLKDTARTVTNITPTLDFRYRFSKVSNLRVRYRGYTTQPGMSDLLDITDDSDPLNITMGNPGLKPSFTNNLSINYNNFVEYHQQAISGFVNLNTTRNSIASKVTYDETTGGRITRPVNVNGNWNMFGGMMYSIAIDSTGYWNVSTSTDVSYSNNVGFLTLDRNEEARKNITRNLSLQERLALSYRNDWLEIEADGSFNYNHARNKLQSQSNMDTWRFAYGASLTLDCPWGTSLSTDLHQNSRRGFSDKSFNTDELVWNAQISQSFLKGKPLSVMIQFYDILRNQSNFSRTINAMQRSDVEYNSINSYAMLHVVYRFNMFGGKNTRREMRGGPDRPGRPDGPGRPGGRGGNRGGRPTRGGFPMMPMM